MWLGHPRKDPSGFIPVFSRTLRTLKSANGVRFDSRASVSKNLRRCVRSLLPGSRFTFVTTFPRKGRKAEWQFPEESCERVIMCTWGFLERPSSLCQKRIIECRNITVIRLLHDTPTEDSKSGSGDYFYRYAVASTKGNQRTSRSENRYRVDFIKFDWNTGPSRKS